MMQGYVTRTLYNVIALFNLIEQQLRGGDKKGLFFCAGGLAFLL